jgi:hypothetical protein
MDILQENYRQDAAAQAEKLHLYGDLAAVAKLDEMTRARVKEVDLKLFMEETLVMTADFSHMNDITQA